MKKDERLKDQFDVKREKEEIKFRTFFENSPFEQLEVINQWLLEQLKQRITKRDVKDRPAFEQLSLSLKIKTTLKEGDRFYFALFEDSKWIPEDYEEEIDDRPFTHSVQRFYNALWNRDSLDITSNLFIYSELDNYVQIEFGKFVANENSLDTFKTWQRIELVINGQWEFRRAWIENIDLALIKYQEEELIELPSRLLHKMAGFINFRRNKKEFSESYVEKFKQQKNKSDWEFIKELIEESDMLNFQGSLNLRSSLLLRLGLKPWLQWVDQLKWPILQDHALFWIKNVEDIEELIEIIVDKQNTFQTKKEHLLLMLLQNYVELAEKISYNLHNLSEGKWSHNDTEDDQSIIDHAKAQHRAWSEKDLQKSIRRVFQLIFNSIPISKSQYFNSVFEWINSLQKKTSRNGRNYRVSNDCLNTINNEFQNKLNNYNTNKLEILKSISIEKINWQVFEKLVGILEYDETDILFRKELQGLYERHIDSEYFKWCEEYENTSINQAGNLAYVIGLNDNPMDAWKVMFEKYNYKYEGWLSSNFSGDTRKREVFVLMVGTCLSYITYKEIGITEGALVFDQLEKITIQQHRFDKMRNDKSYLPIFQLLANITGEFDINKANQFAMTITNRVDTEEIFITTVHILVTQLKTKGNKLRKAIQSTITNRITERFWIIEDRYKNPTLRNDFANFVLMKNAIINTP